MTDPDPAPGIAFMPFSEFFETFVLAERISLTIRACHQEICDMYQAAILGQMEGYEYFKVHMPRRTGKTKILQALPCWMFGEFEDAQMLYGCYSEKLVMQTLSECGRVLNAPWYKGIYGDKIMAQRADHVTTTAGGMLHGAGTQATIAGYGAGLKDPAGGFIALDDPAKPDEAHSAVESANVINNFETTWKGCRNSDRWTPIFINAQRIGPNDLPGYIEKTYPNRTFTLKFPCMVGGISVFPDTWSTDKVKELEQTRVTRFVLASQFQQEPISLGGNMIPTGSFGRYDPATPMKWERTCIKVDTALKTKQANDSSALELWGLHQRKAYLIDLMHGKWEGPDLLNNSAQFWKKWTAIDCGIPRPRFTIEEKAAGTPLLQALQRLGIPAQGIERDIDKVRRVQSILQFIETGMVIIPKDGSVPWIQKFLNECDEFKLDGTQAHDDMVDPMVDAIEDLLGRPLSIFSVLTGNL